MAANVYECMHILDSNRYARDPNGVQESIDGTVTKFEGEILVSRLWNEQKLAYPVNGHRKGTYWLTYIRVEGNRLVELERAFKLNDNVLRSLTLKLDSRLVDPMVAHALGAKTTVVAAETSKQAKSESEPVPSESEQAPSESEQAPSESEPAPSESEQAPTESEATEEAVTEEAAGEA